MKRTNYLSPLYLLLLITFILMSSTAQADSIKDRMKSRLPVIKELKASGVIGEDNKGFLQFRKKEASQTAMVNDENADRRKVYGAIAKKQGADATFVGQRRAVQIAEIAHPGEWLQNSAGQWYQK